MWGIIHVRPKCDGGNRRTPHFARDPPGALPVQHTGSYRKQLLDRRWIYHSSRSDYRGQHGDRSWERRDEGYSSERGGSGKSLQGSESDRRAGSGILLSGQKDPERVSGYLRKEKGLVPAFLFSPTPIIAIQANNAQI